MNIDGIFKGEGAEPFRFKWNDGYRLERVSYMPGLLRVPVLNSDPYHRKHEGKLALPSLSIIVGEPGSGMSMFLDWLQGKLDQPPSASNGAASEWEVVRSFVDAADRLHDLGRENVRIVIDRSDRAAAQDGADARGKKAIARLAGWVENSEWSRKENRVLCLTRDVASLRDNLLFSVITVRGHTFRMPHFDVGGELEQWVAELLKVVGLPSAGFDIRSLAESAKRWTGGQPVLTHLFFSHLQNQLAPPEMKEKVQAHNQPVPPYSSKMQKELEAKFDDAGAFIREHKPLVASYWTNQLNEIVRARPEARRLLLSYIAGEKKSAAEPIDWSAFSPSDVDLFLAGWVGRGPDKKWGIRSECHKTWARDTLRGR